MVALWSQELNIQVERPSHEQILFSGGKTTRALPRNTGTSETSSSSMALRQISDHGPGPGLKRVREEEVRPVPVTPSVEPVEQRWEESEGKYMHKKFKKMASSAALETREASAPSTSHQVPMTSQQPTAFVNHFPLKHSAVSLVQQQPTAPSVSSQRGNEPHISGNFQTSTAPTFQTTSSSSAAFQTSSLAESSSPPMTTEEDDSPNRKRNVCPFCHMVCAKPSVLDKHIRTHTNERPYPW